MRIVEATQKTVAIYPGRFHPFHKGHASVYNFLKSKFDTVYITTSNKIDPPKSPFSFEEKRAMMVHAGIPASVIVQSTQPYRAEEILRNFDPSTTSVAFAVSEKDMEERFLAELASMQTKEIAEKMSAAITGLALPKATSDIADLIDGLGE